jgi:hypothetical protein
VVSRLVRDAVQRLCAPSSHLFWMEVEGESFLLGHF